MDIVRRNNVTVTGNPHGPAVVLAHGFACDQNMWRLTVPALAEDHRVVLFDYVGSGRSDPSAFPEDRCSSLDGYARDVVEVCARPVVGGGGGGAHHAGAPRSPGRLTPGHVDARPPLRPDLRQPAVIRC